MPRILGIDPGGTTGYCLAETEAIGAGPVSILDVGEVKEKFFFDWLDSWTNSFSTGITHVVCEDFIARPTFVSGRWTELPVAKQVGAIAYRAHQLNCIYVVLQPSDKPTGYKAAGLKYVKGKQGTHIQDATAHAMYVAKLGFKPSQRKG